MISDAAENLKASVIIVAQDFVSVAIRCNQEISPTGMIFAKLETTV